MRLHQTDIVGRRVRRRSIFGALRDVLKHLQRPFKIAMKEQLIATGEFHAQLTLPAEIIKQTAAGQIY
jgi:hypothetical protein